MSEQTYAIHYDFTLPSGTRIAGSSSGRVPPRSKELAEQVVAYLNEGYGAGSHWIEPDKESTDESLWL